MRVGGEKRAYVGERAYGEKDDLVGVGFNGFLHKFDGAVLREDRLMGETSDYLILMHRHLALLPYERHSVTGENGNIAPYVSAQGIGKLRSLFRFAASRGDAKQLATWLT